MGRPGNNKRATSPGGLHPCEDVAWRMSETPGSWPQYLCFPVHFHLAALGSTHAARWQVHLNPPGAPAKYSTPPTEQLSLSVPGCSAPCATSGPSVKARLSFIAMPEISRCAQGACRRAAEQHPQLGMPACRDPTAVQYADWCDTSCQVDYPWAAILGGQEEYWLASSTSRHICAMLKMRDAWGVCCMVKNKLLKCETHGESAA